jgi:hypothetical protein
MVPSLPWQAIVFDSCRNWGQGSVSHLSPLPMASQPVSLSLAGGFEIQESEHTPVGNRSFLQRVLYVSVWKVRVFHHEKMDMQHKTTFFVPLD